MPRPLQIPVPTVRRKDMHGRYYLEPTGPATNTIDCIMFSSESAASLARMEQFKLKLDSETIEDSMRERCSVDDLLDEVTKVYSDKTIYPELETYHEEALLGDAPPEEWDEDEPADEEDERPAKKTRMLGPDAANILEEARSNRLAMTKAIPDRAHFLRKTRTPDYNKLATTRAAQSDPIALPTPSSLSNLLITLTFQPIVKHFNRTSPLPAVTQTMLVLGSTTLYEIRQNVLTGGDAIPAEMVDSGEEEEGEEEGAYYTTRTKRKKWTEERRVTGSVFGINQVLYPDIGEGKVDYAELIMRLSDEVDWEAVGRAGKSKWQIREEEKTAEREVEAQRQRSLSASASRSPEAQRPSAPTPSRAQHSSMASDQQATKSENIQIPRCAMGGAMQETRIGELNLKIGEPYWFMHQGNSEHVWVIDSIRHVHPADPVPVSTASSKPYPLTTFLSRLIALKCRICDRDPGSIVTIDDELAGESPSLMCVTCFEMLHGDNEDGHVTVIPTLPEM